MAEVTGGQTFNATELGALTSVLTFSDRFIPELSLTETLQDLIGWKTLLMALIALLGVEWVVRRWAGTY